MTNSNKYLALTALGFFMTGCTGLTKNQAALVGANSLRFGRRWRRRCYRAYGC